MPTARPLTNPAEEFERVKVLRSLQLDDAKLEQSLQEIVQRVGAIYGTRVCMVNLVLADRHVFQAWSGDLPPDLTAARQMPRENSICSYVVASHVPLVIEDLLESDEWRDQYMSATYGLRFYAGVPLVSHNTHALGTLCLADIEPRTITAEGLETLQMFAARAAAELELAGEHERARSLREQLETTSTYAHAVAEYMLALQSIDDVERIADLAVRTVTRASRLDGCALVGVLDDDVAALAATGTLPEIVTVLDPSTLDSWCARRVAPPQMISATPLDGIRPPMAIIASRNGGSWNAQDPFLFDAVARATSAAIARCRRLRDLEEAAVTDELTGIGNRRALELLAAHPRRLGDSYRVLLGDLAGFKSLNDQMGHSVGDILLRDVARAIMRELRPSDASRVFRYGGDEFVIVLGGTEGDRVAERLEHAIENLAREYPGIDVRLDIGEAVVPRDAETLEAALKIADQRMYERKRGARPSRPQ